MAERTGDPSYVLERTDRERDRLDLQGLIYRDITVRALRDGGIEPGMRVLDIGCGSGDVSRLAAALVGPRGEVVGVDHDPAAVESARARRAGLANARYLAADITRLADELGEAGGFDALVGRFVLMHQADPARVLAAALRAVRPGGRAVLLESHMAGLLDARHSLPFSALYDRIVRWQCAVVDAAGADIESGLRLRQTMLDAGLPEPALRFEASVEAGSASLVYDYVCESSLSMLAMAEANGIEGFTREELDGMAGRLRRSVVSDGGVVLAWPVVCGWSSKE